MQQFCTPAFLNHTKTWTRKCSRLRTRPDSCVYASSDVRLTESAHVNGKTDSIRPLSFCHIVHKLPLGKEIHNIYVYFSKVSCK